MNRISIELHRNIHIIRPPEVMKVNLVPELMELSRIQVLDGSSLYCLDFMDHSLELDTYREVIVIITNQVCILQRIHV